jgi:hypothetical protein
VPEEQIPVDPAALHEIRKGVIDYMDREDATDRARFEKIDKIIRNRNSATLPGERGTEHRAYCLKAEQELEDAKREIARITGLIGTFGERSLINRLLHYAEYRDFQTRYDAAIREEQHIEERLRIAKIGYGNDY